MIAVKVKFDVYFLQGWRSTGGENKEARAEMEYLDPAGALLHCIPDLLRSLAHNQVVGHIAALPPALHHLHAQSKILCERISRRASSL